jgi:hypothetical protein
MSDLARRVADAVEEQRQSYVASGYEGPMPLHGEAGGAKWRVDDLSDPDNARWEGGYVCHCGEVFARTHEQGGMRVAREALFAHEVLK